MNRGTTPTLRFELKGIELELIDKAIFTMQQNLNGKCIEINKDATVYSDYLSVSLTQQETLSFGPGHILMQLKIKLKDGNVVASNITEKTIKDILNEVIL